jgi:hypothetical protein
MRPTFLHVTLLAVFALAAAGCATIQANITETAKWQGLADQATAALGSGPVTVLLKGNTRTGQYFRLSRTVELGTESNVAGKEWLLAHELSHHIRGHVNAYLEQEMEANTTAVQVLQVWGRSEAEAVRLVGSRLLSIHKTGSILTGKGHDWCAEYHDIARRYPQYPAPAGAEVCGVAMR